MRPADGKILFKEWLPDLPALDNPGLVEALNVVPSDLTYKAYQPLSPSYGTLGAAPLGSIRVKTTGNQDIIYAGDSTSLAASTIGAFTELSASTYNATNWDFCVYENLVLATNANVSIQAHTIGSATNFFTAGSASGTAPAAAYIGRVGQFVVAGNLANAPYRIQWCAIDNPLSWPAPNSATANASQAGQQDLTNFGGVSAIRGGDQFGVIWQPGGMHRMTYVGGGVVFQFDPISKEVGTRFSKSIVNVGKAWYFASDNGFYMTDGASVVSIGSNKVDRYFLRLVDRGKENEIYGAADPIRKVIYWAFPYVTSNAGTRLTDFLLIYNYEENRWSSAAQVTAGLTQHEWMAGEASPLFGFGNTFQYGQFSATAGTATLTTGEIEPNPGGYARVQGIKPLVAATLNAVTVALGTRTDQETAPSYTAETTANARTGFADFRTEARYVRARVTVTGTFNSAQGVEFQVVPSGAV